MYHGKVVKYNHAQTIKTTAYSFVDLLAESGGLLSGLYYSTIPIALTFSRFSFNLGVISLLFMAKMSTKDYHEDYTVESINSLEYLAPQKNKVKHVRVNLTSQ